MNLNHMVRVSSCYVHIPFCDNICSYCDFCKLFYNKKIIVSYLDSLEKEIDNFYKNEKLETIYIGGGTPSCLSIEELERLFKILTKLKKSKNVEYTMECNFESISKEKLDLCKDYGINRLSFGIESINKSNLEYLERNLDKEKVEEIIDYAKSIGIVNINLDLIYAIPGETKKILEEDIDYILSLDVFHISTYSLIIEDHTKLGIKKEKNIDEDLDYEMYKLISNRLKMNGYEHYEISNFSKKGCQSRHNTCYWNNDCYYGFGLGASSYIDNMRSTNTKSITKYLQNDLSKTSEVLTEHDKIEYEIMLNLRKNSGIDLKLFKEKYGLELESIYNYQRLIEDGLLIKNDNFLFINEEKWYISNEIIVRLLGCEVK